VCGVSRCACLDFFVCCVLCVLSVVRSALSALCAMCCVVCYVVSCYVLCVVCSWRESRQCIELGEEVWCKAS